MYKLSHVIKTAESVGDNNFLMKSTPIYVCLCTVCMKVNEERDILYYFKFKGESKFALKQI
jgi:hypothetical protein